MPFTLAHIALAPPLHRLTGRRVVLSAVVVGAISPDFEYFVHLRPERTISHTPLGIFALCLPASIVVLWCWHRFLGPTLAPLLPGQLRTAAARPFPWRPLPRFAVICGSIVLGAFSHLAWDSLTNEGGSMVRTYAQLQAPLWNGAGPARYVVLWYASSVFGVGLTTWWLVSMAGVLRRRRMHIPVDRTLLLRRISACAPVVTMATMAGVVNARAYLIPGMTRTDQLAAGVIGAMSGAAIGVVAVAVALRAVELHRARSTTSPEEVRT
jgi:hypothetical protein